MCCAWCSWDDHLYAVLGAHGMIICMLCLVLIGWSFVCCAWCSWDDHLCAVLGAHGMIICMLCLVLMG